MRKLIVILALAAAVLPASAFASHLDGTWGGWGSNFISIGVGNQSMRYGHSRHVSFVDDYGAPVEYRTLRRGHPITVDYAGEHGHEHVNRVIVHQRRGGHHRHNH